MDPAMGIMAAMLVILGLVAMSVDGQRRSLAEKNERLADELDDQYELNYQLRRRLEAAKQDPLNFAVDREYGGWVPSSRRRLERIFTRGWVVNPEEDKRE